MRYTPFLLLLPATLSWAFTTQSSLASRQQVVQLQMFQQQDDNRDNSNNNKSIFHQWDMKAKATVAAVGLSLAALGTNPLPAMATSDPGAIVSCLFTKCQLPLAKCIANPKCLANVICINTCNGKEDEIGCQIKCGDLFENSVVGEFNKCAVSDMGCVPQQQDEGLYPEPNPELLVKNFNTNLWNGKWYITAGQNKLFDIFPCQVHFFTETSPGKFFGKLNWRIEEPDGEYFDRDALQEFVQDKKNSAHLINHDNEYLHYKDDWYIVDCEYDNNKDGIPPFAFVYYRGSNDAWDGYGGVVVYTRASKLPESLLPRLRVAAEKVGFDFDKDFTITDNTCPTMAKGEAVVLREKFAGKVILQTEEQLQAEATRLRGAAVNSAKAEKRFLSDRVGEAEKAALRLEKELEKFEQEQAAKFVELEKGIVEFEKEEVAKIVEFEKEEVAKIVEFEKEEVAKVVEFEKKVLKF